jgi:hypothetical protein
VKHTRIYSQILKQAHKVCVGQNELVLSCLEKFDLNEGPGQIMNINFLTGVDMINHEKYEVYSRKSF